MEKKRLLLGLLAALFAGGACRPAEEPVKTEATSVRTAGPYPAPSLTFAPDLAERLRRLPPTPIDYDRSLLDEGDRQVVEKLIEASRVIDEIFLRQVSEENPALRRDLQTAAAEAAPLAAEALAYFEINKGPWDRLEENKPFVGEKTKPPGAAFYPDGITKEEVERWLAAHPADKEAFQGLFTIIRRQGEGLVAIPYSRYYKEPLTRAAAKVHEAAALTDNTSLRRYLKKRADALLSDDYFASDIAWMDLDSDIEVVIGPYEVYEDDLFNYKAAFESFVTARDREESQKLGVFTKHLREMEKNLPIPDEHKNLDRGFESPIKVVQEIFTAGDARSGVMTSAFNLPNDEKVREAKGSKKVLMKNVMEAKFQKSGRPIAQRVLDPAQVPRISFAAYFDHTLFHELAHGLGPGVIRGPDGKKVDSRLLLKNLYSTIEECKADVLGLWNLLYAREKKLPIAFDEETLFATNVGLMFRSMRFGLDEAHGRGNAVQWNWFREKGAILPAAKARFRVETTKFREALRDLAHELLMIEATGDFERAEKLLDRYGKGTPEITAVIARLSDIPVDIAPVFVAAGEK